MQKKFYAFLSVLAIAGFLLIQACNGPKPSKCVITVMDHSGQKPLSGVKVHLYATTYYNGKPTTADLKADAVTDGSGKCSFSFKNPCVMDISAAVSNCTASAANQVYCSGSGIVKCEEGKTTEKTIYINN